MMPMDYTSTPFLSYSDIKTDEIDIIDDAWGFLSEFNDVAAMLQFVRPVPDDELIRGLIKKIRHMTE